MVKLHRVLSLIDKALGEFCPVVRVVEHYTNEEPGTEYINVRISIHQLNALLVLREYWRRGELVAYSYYIRIKGYEEWWDNRPHHPEIQTFPHHRHAGGGIHPLQNPSLEEFLKRAKEILSKSE